MMDDDGQNNLHAQNLVTETVMTERVSQLTDKVRTKSVTIESVSTEFSRLTDFVDTYGTNIQCPLTLLT
jgi:hypothetical protein